jgi:hypothetical protein
VLGVAVLLTLGVAHAETSALDEPGAQAVPDEPGVSWMVVESVGKAPRFRIEVGAGYASLLEDPDVAEGYGGGLYLSFEFVRRVGAELSVFFSRNPYDDELGEFGTSFLAGNITLGPTVRLTRPGSRVLVTLDAAVGTYVIVPVLQDNIWTLGISGGMTVALKITSWLGLSLKPRYHLFNLAKISGPEFRDLKALMEVGVIDRFEIPLCLSFTF